jgi:hypothetical protein
MSASPTNASPPACELRSSAPAPHNPFAATSRSMTFAFVIDDEMRVVVEAHVFQARAFSAACQ